MTDEWLSRRARRAQEGHSEPETDAFAVAGPGTGGIPLTNPDGMPLSRKERRRLERLIHPVETWTAEEEMIATGQIPTLTPEVIAEQERIAREKAAQLQAEAELASRELRRVSMRDVDPSRVAEVTGEIRTHTESAPSLGAPSLATPVVVPPVAAAVEPAPVAIPEPDAPAEPTLVVSPEPSTPATPEPAAEPASAAPVSSFAPPEPVTGPEPTPEPEVAASAAPADPAEAFRHLFPPGSLQARAFEEQQKAAQEAADAAQAAQEEDDAAAEIRRLTAAAMANLEKAGIPTDATPVVPAEMRPEDDDDLEKTVPGAYVTPVFPEADAAARGAVAPPVEWPGGEPVDLAGATAHIATPSAPSPAPSAPAADSSVPSLAELAAAAEAAAHQVEAAPAAAEPSGSAAPVAPAEDDFGPLIRREPAQPAPGVEASPSTGGIAVVPPNAVPPAAPEVPSLDALLGEIPSPASTAGGSVPQAPASTPASPFASVNPAPESAAQSASSAPSVQSAPFVESAPSGQVGQVFAPVSQPSAPSPVTGQVPSAPAGAGVFSPDAGFGSVPSSPVPFAPTTPSASSPAAPPQAAAAPAAAAPAAASQPAPSVAAPSPAGTVPSAPGTVTPASTEPWENHPLASAPTPTVDVNAYTPVTDVPKPDLTALTQQSNPFAPVASASTGSVPTPGVFPATGSVPQFTPSGQVPTVRKDAVLQPAGGIRESKWAYYLFLAAIAFFAGVAVYWVWRNGL